MIGYLAFAAFAATVPMANWLIGNVGTECIPNGPCLIPVGFGLMAPSGVLMVGAALVLRDVVHERLGQWWAVAAIVVGAILSAFFAAPSLVTASATAFLLAEAADFAVYAPLRRKHLAWAVLLSGIAGAVIDSAVFLWIAFGSLSLIEGQIVGKMWMTLLAAGLLFARRRRRKRDRVRADLSTLRAAWNRRAALDLSPPVVEEGLSLPRVDGKIAPPVEIGYTNYRGEFAVRCIVPVSFWYGSTDWHPEPQWLVKAWDADKGAERDFAFKDFSPPASPSKPEEPAPVTVPEPQAVAWRIDTDDQVELLAKECGINNRLYMTPKDYSIWCEQQRQFARLAAAPLSGGGKVEVTNGVVDAQWQWLCDKDDRSSPVEYPDMALVTRDELGEIIVAVLSTMGGKP